MRHLLTVFFALSIYYSHSQNKIEIPAESFPFYDIIEWKGSGALLLNRDPNSTTSKINLTFVSNENSLTWKSTVNCSDKNSYFITSENSRYNYFFDNVTTENGKFSYSQIAPSGYVKSQNQDLFYHIKKSIPIEYADMHVMDIFTTDKALVYLFRYNDKKNKKVVDIAVSMTHNNFILYTGIIGETTDLVLKNNPDFGWIYIGSTGEKIYFATKDVQAKKQGFMVRELNTRMETQKSFFIEDVQEKFETIENSGFGATGKNYFKHENLAQKSILTFNNSKFYLSGFLNSNGNYEIKTFELIENKWDLKNQYKTSLTASKKLLAIGIFPINEGLIFKMEGAQSILAFQSFSEKYKNSIVPFKSELVYNPSCVLTDEYQGKISFDILDRILYFDKSQLGKKSSVYFEVKVK